MEFDEEKVGGLPGALAGNLKQEPYTEWDAIVSSPINGTYSLFITALDVGFINLKFIVEPFTPINI